MAALPKAVLQASGDTLSLELQRQVGLRAGVPYRLVPYGAEALLLLKEGAGPQGFFAGDLTSYGVAELFGHLLAGVRSGQLIVTQGAVRRNVALHDGQVVFASSTAGYERLGRSLVRRKLIGAAQLEAALAQVGPGSRLGQVLTRMKVLSAATLYSAMAELVKEIVLGLFESPEGHFLFLEGGNFAEDKVKLPERTREVVLEGIRRAEQLGPLRRRFPPNLRLACAPALAGSEDPVLAAAVEGAEISVLRSSYEGGEHAFWSAIAKLHDEGALIAQPQAKPSRPLPRSTEPPSTLQLYGSLIKTICSALGSAGKDLSDLRSFLEDPLPGLEEAFAGVKLGDDGTLDVKRVRRNISAQDEAVAKALAYEALDAFVSYSLFSAKNVLPPELATALASEFKRLQDENA